MGNQMHCSPVPGRGKSKLPANMFKVKNINEQGEVIWRGVIEVNMNDLVLHQKVGDPVRWPLKSLRRYGSDKGLFSFESGRSCVTGPGIYAFKCKNAEHLFNLVKKNTNEGGGDNPTTSGVGEQTPEQSRAPRGHTTMPHNHFNSLSRIISTNGRIAGRHASSPTLPGPAGLVSPNLNGSTSMTPVPSSPAIEYTNAAELRETGPLRTQEASSPPAVRPPVKPSSSSTPSRGSTAPISLNYAHLKLGQDEDDAVIEDGSLKVVTADVDRTETGCDGKPSDETDFGVTEGDVTTAKVGSPISLKDENDNKTGLIAYPPHKELPRSVKTGLLVEIGSEVNNLVRTPPGLSPEHGMGQMTYVNLDRSPKVLRPAHRVQSPNFAKGRGGYSSQNSPSYYTNLDTKGELPPRSTRLPVAGQLGSPEPGIRAAGDLRFNFHSDKPRGSKDYTDIDSAATSEHENIPSGSNYVIQSPPKGDKLNYVQVAFEDGTVSSVPPGSNSSGSSGSSPPNTPNSPRTDTESPGKASDAYAVIDTNKTMALANSQRQINDGDIATRRTRHDGPVQPR